MNIVRPDAFCEALFAPQGMAFRGGENVYTEDAGGSSPSSPTIFSITYGKTANLPIGSLNLRPYFAIDKTGRKQRANAVPALTETNLLRGSNG